MGEGAVGYYVYQIIVVIKSIKDLLKIRDFGTVLLHKRGILS
jgi:hypothetical protein